MILGHLPAGYITAKLLYKHCQQRITSYKAFMFWGLLGSVSPDFDMLYFHLIDHRQHHHHSYASHFPIVWIPLLALSILLLRLKPRRPFAVFAFVFCLGGFIHLLLDSIVGDIWWLAPFIDKPFALATVPAKFHPWWLNFILHWSFGLEIGVIVVAGWLRVKSRNSKPIYYSRHQP